jgi:UDP:flavonoid glycosyltransferase YjiC (YdhE family)
MTTFLWLSHASGGNLPPSLGVAHALRDRGHEVIFLCRTEAVQRIEHEGLRAEALATAYAEIDKFPAGSPMAKIACALTSPTVAAEITRRINDLAPDVLLVDAMFPSALSAAASSNRPSVVFSHTFFYRQLAEWEDVFGKIAGLHAGAGFPPWPSREELWKGQDHIIVTSSGELDDAPVAGWTNVQHVGPVLDNEATALPADLPWEASEDRPLVLVSLSTTELASSERLQTVLTALADLPVRVMATTSPQIDPASLDAPANAHVVQYANHDVLLQRAALIVTHGGHGTMMRALRHGVPMVVIPGMPHDQVPNGALVEAHGAGLRLVGGVDAGVIRTAVRQILDDHAFRDAAVRLSDIVRPLDGARVAARTLEDIAAASAGPAH